MVTFQDVIISHQYVSGNAPPQLPARIQVEHHMDPVNSTSTLIAEAPLGNDYKSEEANII